MILSCDCENEWQDERYGKGRRVFNEMKKAEKGAPQKYRCTVCLREKAEREEMR
jgi:ribosomal protein L37AE/L43A